MGRTYHFDEDKPRQSKEDLKRARRERSKSRRIQPDERPKRFSEKVDKDDEKDLSWD